MCGIAGIVSRAADAPPPELDRVLTMAGTLSHRGPDEFGVYRDRRAALGHARLAIIDLATGQQPLSNEDGSIWIAFNGEIFNYLELRDELCAAGHRFATRSDTEVIVHAYEEWGEDAFRRFNGQWAVALWIADRDTLVLARDPFGVRPLYITECDGRLYFASEVKALFAGDPAIRRAFDPVAMDQLFTFWTPLAPRTVFHGVEELEPGAVRTYTSASVRQTGCWTPAFATGPSKGFEGSLEDAVERLRYALGTATELRMLRADVPVGSYLSGGLDSSLIAALGLAAKGDRFATFSIRFEDAEYDETTHQRAMARYLGSDHHERVVTRGDIARVFPDVVFHAERPVLRTAAAPMFLLSRLVRDAGIKVVLTGEGADEMFAGYDLFREAKIRRFWARQPDSRWRPLLLDRLYPYLARSPVAQRAMARQFFGQHLERWSQPGFGHLPRWQSTGALKRLFAPVMRERLEGLDAVRTFVESLPPEFPLWHPTAQDQYVEIRTLLSGYLLSAQGDRMLMANSVEGRFPFLDREVASLAQSLPSSYLLRGLSEKHVLRRAAEGRLPDSILHRVKQPYRAPDALALSAPEAAPWVEAVASVAAIAEAGIFDPPAARRLLDKCRARSGTGQLSNADNMALVGLLSTQLVHHQFVRSRPLGAPPPVIRTVVDRLGVGETSYCRSGC